jgi:hypothetical protein
MSPVERNDGPWRRSWRRLCARRGARWALGLLGLIIALALLVPALSPYDYAAPS